MTSYKVFLDKIQNLEIQNLPFVAFKYPFSDDIFLIHQNDDTLYIAENFKEKGFVISSFSGDNSFLIKQENTFSSKIENENFTVSEKDIPYNEF